MGKPDLQYFVVAPDGSKYGPGDITKLRQWASEGRILPQTWIQQAETGEMIRASELPNMYFGSLPPRVDQKEDNQDAVMTFVFGGLTLMMCAPIFCWFAWHYSKRAEARGGSMAQGARVVGIVSLVWGSLWLMFAFIWLVLAGATLWRGLS